MQKVPVYIPAIKLIGLKVRTNNRNEFNAETAQIGSTVAKYFQERWTDKILHRKNPGVTLCAYTEYESDYTGDYTYYIGEEVTSMSLLSEGLSELRIPAQQYIKFMTEPGPMPHVEIEAWQKIWIMSPDELGGVRSYNTDLVVYDERAHAPGRAVVDIYIGIKG
jgi:predicted transcriptional regulator YdeE